LKKIAVVTGTRAEYGLLKPVMQRMKEDKEIELVLITCGMHYDKNFGYTINQIINDGFQPSIELNTYPLQDTLFDYAQFFALISKSLAENLINHEITAALVLGDRVEILAVTSIFILYKIPVLHLHGGEISGNIDNIFRNAITKMAHYHFPSTQNHAKRIIKMGEESDRVEVIGSLGYNQAKKFMDGEIEYESDIELPTRPYFVILMHPESEFEKITEQMGIIYNTIKNINMNLIIIDPNSDPGGRTIQNIYDNWKINNIKIQRYKSVNQLTFFHILKNSEFLIGNSSSGMIEAHALRIPVINIGSRQAGRDSGGNVISVNWDENELKDLINKILHDFNYKQNLINSESPFYKKDPEQLIIEKIKTIKFSDDFFNKRMTY